MSSETCSHSESAQHQAVEGVRVDFEVRRPYNEGCATSTPLIREHSLQHTPESPDSTETNPGSCAVILAAGKSTRMRSDLPKPLHPVCGLPLTAHVIRACREAGVGRVIVVVGHEAARVRAGLGDEVEYVLQAEQLGSGHAAMCAEEALRDFSGSVLIVAGDVPLVKPETLRRLIAAAAQGDRSGAMLTAWLKDPTGYGRVICDDRGNVLRIVEHRDASPEERAIKVWNPSIYCLKAAGLFEMLHRIGSDNAQGELYLTDVVGLASAAGRPIAAVPVEDAREVLGVNTRVELAEVARHMRMRVLERLMLAGVTVVDPAATYVDVDVEVGRDTVIEPQTHLLGDTTVGERCTIGPMAVVQNMRVGDDTTVVQSRVCDGAIGSRVRIGPFANIRPGCVIRDGAKIGDFVELKNADIGEGVAASHLSYIGDADVGPGTNVGAGTITCNYDGYHKHRTVIGARAFIGSHTTLVAPVRVGDGAMTAAGTVVTEDVEPDSMAIARARQTNREGWAARWRAAHERHRENAPVPASERGSRAEDASVNGATQGSAQE